MDALAFGVWISPMDMRGQHAEAVNGAGAAADSQNPQGRHPVHFRHPLSLDPSKSHAIAGATKARRQFNAENAGFGAGPYLSLPMLC